MAEPDREFGKTAEPGPQPDPMLNEGRAGAGRKWAVTAVVAAVLLAVMYGVTTHRAELHPICSLRARWRCRIDLLRGRALIGL